MRTTRIYILLALLISAANSLLAQSTVGTDFWMTILPNAKYTPAAFNMYVLKPVVKITGERPCSGTISNPHTGWTRSFEVEEGVATVLDIPEEQAYAQDSSDCVLETALHILTTDSVSVFVGNYRRGTFDVSCALPTPMLGNNYMVQTYEAFGNDETTRSVLSVIAVEDNTTIDFLLTCNTCNGHFANVPFSVTLQEGQVYQMQSVNYQNFNGSRVTSRNQKQNFAVIVAGRDVFVPDDATTCADHAEEQMMPISTLGRRFVLTQTLHRNADMIRVTALKDHCEIRQNGTLLTIINANQCFDFEITADEPASFLETSEPAMVGMYATGSQYENYFGDPDMVIINPVEQQTESVIFPTFRTTYVRRHFINIVAETSKLSGMMLDTVNISSQFDVVPGNPEYSYARMEIEDGTYRLSNSTGGFLAFVYGYGHAEAYAYSAGAKIWTSELMVDNEPELEHPVGFEAGIDEPMNFMLRTNYDISEAHWDFGDGQTVTTTDRIMQHSYAIGENYRLSCDIYRQNAQGQSVFAGRVSTVIHVLPYDQIEEANGLKLAIAYPNPGGSEMHIRTAVENAAVEVYDMNGRLVAQQPVTETETMLDATEWAAGTYVWKVVSGVSTSSTTLIESGKWIKE